MDTGEKKPMKEFEIEAKSWGSQISKKESLQKFISAAERLSTTRTKESPLVLAIRKSLVFFKQQFQWEWQADDNGLKCMWKIVRK